MRDGLRDDYEALYSQFRWHVPDRFNIAQACCTRWAGDARRTALIVDHGDGRTERVTYRRLQRDGNRLANALRALPEAQRQVLLLVAFEDLSYEQVATVVGVPVGTVMSRLSRARAGLHALLEPAAGHAPRSGPRLRVLK